MEESILNELKAMLGVNEDNTAFDQELIADINAAIGVLNQIGIGVEDFFLVDDSQKWTDLLGETRLGFQIIKQYIYLRVRVVFDSSTMSSSVMQTYNELADKYEYRLNVMYETRQSEGDTP